MGADGGVPWVSGRLAEWFDLRSRLAEANDRIAGLQADLDDAGETRAYLRDQCGTAEAQVKTMTIMRDSGTVDAAALRVAQEIEDLFVRGCSGGRSQRLAQIQVMVIGVIQDALRGGRDFDLGWRKRHVE